MNSWNKWSLELRRDYNKKESKLILLKLMLAHLRVAKAHLLSFIQHISLIFGLVKRESFVLTSVSVILLLGVYFAVKTNRDRPQQFISLSEDRVVKIEYRMRNYTSEEDIMRLLSTHKFWDGAIYVK